MTLRRADRVFWRAAPGWLVLADRDGALTEVSGPGSAVWEALESPIEETALVGLLAARYALPAAQIADDVGPLLAGLVERGLVVSED